jgi:hypothetical protein
MSSLAQLSVLAHLDLPLRWNGFWDPVLGAPPSLQKKYSRSRGGPSIVFRVLFA